MTEQVENDLLRLMKQDTKVITSDLLTKALGRQDFYRHVSKLMSRESGEPIQISGGNSNVSLMATEEQKWRIEYMFMGTEELQFEGG